MGTLTRIPPYDGTLRLYVDGTAGNDNASGQGGWANAWQTAAKLETAIASILFIEPIGLLLEVFLRGTFTAQDLRIFASVASTSRVYIGQHVDDFTQVRIGTVFAVGGEAPAPKHGMERLTLNGCTLNGTELGMTLLLTDPVTGTNRGTATIVRIDTVNPGGGKQYVWVSLAIGGFPTWVAASPANVTVRVPSAYVPGVVTFGVESDYVYSGANATTLYSNSWLIGVRCDSMELRGKSGVAACYVRSVGGTWGTITSIGMVFGSWSRYVSGGQSMSMPDSVAQDYGLIGGPTPIAYNTVGNAANGWDVMSDLAYAIGGYYDGELASQWTGANANIQYASFARMSAYTECWANVYHGICRCTTTNGIYATLGATSKVQYLSFLDLPANGCAAAFSVTRSGKIRVANASVEGNITGAGACDLFLSQSRGVIQIEAALLDGLKAKTRQFVCDGGDIVCLGQAENFSP